MSSIIIIQRFTFEKRSYISENEHKRTTLTLIHFILDSQSHRWTLVECLQDQEKGIKFIMSVYMFYSQKSYVFTLASKVYLL